MIQNVFGVVFAFVFCAMFYLFTSNKKETGVTADAESVSYTHLDVYKRQVFIHPFTDGNDRMARLWHTAILAKWNPIFESGTPHSHYFSDELGVPIFLQICAIKCRSCVLIL